MLKRFLVCVLVAIVLSVAGQSNFALAHTLKVDGNIGVVLHVDPEDDPVAREKAMLYFDIKDKQGKFSLSGCDCRVDIFQGNDLKNSVQLFGQPAVQYVFESRGIYRIELKGRPLQDGTFQNFSVSFDQRVARGGQSENATEEGERHGGSSFGPWMIVLAIALVLLFGVLLWKKGRSLFVVFLLIFAFVFSQTGLVHAWCGGLHSHGQHLHESCKNAPVATSSLSVVSLRAATLFSEKVFVYNYSAVVVSILQITNRAPPIFS